jgi:hypothetical protein
MLSGYSLYELQAIQVAEGWDSSSSLQARTITKSPHKDKTFCYGSTPRTLLERGLWKMGGYLLLVKK